jgi:uncharacterized SAM-dependent methyltransferase
MMELPEEYTTRAPVREDAGEVAALVRAADLADNGSSDMSVEELLDDWHSLDLAEEAAPLWPFRYTVTYTPTFVIWASAPT